MNTASASCGCCEGVEKLTPMTLANRAGLGALAYRAGTYSTFFETMLARLSNLAIDVPTGKYDGQGKAVTTPLFPLAGLTTRELSDPAIALLDSWAMVADVLTFYDERIANEGYLRTATERRSVLELARLIGYTLRPGVAATAYLAYTIEEDLSVTPPKGMEVTIPAGSQAQSVPGPDEMPQTFETAAPLRARTAWNILKPRMSEPQTVQSIIASGLWLKGTSTGLKTNDPILIDAGVQGIGPIPLRVVEVKADTANDRTHVSWRLWFTSTQMAALVTTVAAQHAANPLPGPTANKARAILRTLQETSQEMTGDPHQLSEFVERETLPALTELHQSVTGKAKNLQPWLQTMTDELGSVQLNLRASWPAEAAAGIPLPQQTATFFHSLRTPPAVTPANAATLPRSVHTSLMQGADVFPRLLTTFRPRLRGLLAPALANVTIAERAPIKVYALRVTAPLFGHNAPDQPKFDGNGHLDGFEAPTFTNTWKDVPGTTAKFPTIALDAEYGEIQPQSWMVIERPSLTMPVTIHTVQSTATATLAGLGVSAKVTLPTVSPPWFDKALPQELQAAQESTPVLRGTRVYAQSELLPLAEVPMNQPICAAEIELDGFYDELETGRWVILSGERVDVFDPRCKPVTGIQSAELAMILSVSHRVRTLPDPKPAPNQTVPQAEGEPVNPVEEPPPTPPGPIENDSGYEDKAAPKETLAFPGDKTHTFITLSKDPAYCYARDKITIYGNVVKATHGETCPEVLGNGDASKPMQMFTLRQPPLTFLPAPTPAGAASTLVLRVNEVQWHETDTLAGSAPDDRKFITKTDHESKTTVIFGNGREGARPPTGNENITAVYRKGIGAGGNARAEQISQLGSRPLGVKDVINPLAATGGADSENRDQARKNAPLGVLALDRLVSVRDYADFAQTFAGIGKASSIKLSDGTREVVHVTIAGANDIPISQTSDLYRNLVAALKTLGDPYLPIQVKLREMLSLVISANVGVLPDYAWEFVEPKVRAALLDAFSFERRELAQDVTKSEVISVVQRVRGVAFVDLDLLAAISESDVEAEITKTTLNAGQKGNGQAAGFSESLADVKHRVAVRPARVNPQAAEFSDRIAPAQLAVLSPELPETLVLMEAKG
jgi:hypothetical protein